MTDDNALAPDAAGPPSPIVAALAEAAHALQVVQGQVVALQEEIRALQYRATQLHRFIAAGHGLWGDVGTTDPAGALQGVSPPTLSAAAYAEQVLTEVGHPMRAGEIAATLHQRGLMCGRWTREVLRTAMRHHTDIFTCVAVGVYGLHAWKAQPIHLVAIEEE